MLFSEKRTPAQRQFLHAVFVPAIITLFFILVFVFERGMGWDFHKAGILPRDIEHVLGILTYVFIHADWGHLLNNSISFLLLSSCLYYFYKQIASKVLLLSYLISGIMLWIIGRDSWHIGASGLIYSIAFFLFFSGLLRKHIPLIAISLIVTFLYGSMVWHVFPWQVNDPISWEGHLSGGVAGLALSLIFRKDGPQRPEKIWDDEDDTSDLDYSGEDEPVDELRNG